MIPSLACKYVNLTPPAAIVDNAAFTVAELDTNGWDYCTILVTLGATDIAAASMTVEDGDVSGTTAAVTGLVYGTSTNSEGSTSAKPTATDDNDIFAFDIDLRSRKRYIQATLTAGDGSAGTFATVLAILSRGKEYPSTAAERGLNQACQV